MAKYVTKSRRKVTVSSMPGVWMTASDPSGTRSNTTRRPGAGEPLVVITSRLTWESITVTKMWDPDTDGPIWSRLNSGDPFNETTLTFVDLDSDGVASAPDAYAGCAVESFMRSGSDANADDEIVELSITFTVPRKG
jgi:hypothetical protein